MKHLFRISAILTFCLFVCTVKSISSDWISQGDYYVNKTLLTSVDFIRVSIDGTKFYTYSKEDTTFRIWDYLSGEIIDSIAIPASQISNVDLSPDEKFLLFYTQNTQYKLDYKLIKWDLEKEEAVFSIEPGIMDFKTVEYSEWIRRGQSLNFKFTPDGNEILLHYRTTVTKAEEEMDVGFCDFREATKGDFVKRLFDDYILQIEYSDNMEHIAVRNMWRHEIDDGVNDYGRSAKLDTHTIDYGRVFCFSHDSKKLCMLDPFVRIYNTEDATEISTQFDFDPYWKKLASYSRCNNFIIAASVNELLILDEKTSLPIERYSGLYSVLTIDTHPDSTSILAGNQKGEIHLIKPYVFTNPFCASFYIDKKLDYLDEDGVQFYDATKGEPTDWLWDFGDGQTSIQQHPIHNYDTPGIYTIKMISRNGTQTDTIIKESFLELLPQLIPDIKIDPVRGTAPLEVEISNQSTGQIDSIKWVIGEDRYEEENLTLTFNEPGNHSVKLYAYDKIGMGSENRYCQIYVEDPEKKDVITDKPLRDDGASASGFITFQTSEGNYFSISSSRYDDFYYMDSLGRGWFESRSRYCIFLLDSNLNWLDNYFTDFPGHNQILNALGSGHFADDYLILTHSNSSDSSSIVKIGEVDNEVKADSLFQIQKAVRLFRFKNGDLLASASSGKALTIKRYDSKYNMLWEDDYDIDLSEYYNWKYGYMYKNFNSFEDGSLLVTGNKSLHVIDNNGNLTNSFSPWTEETYPENLILHSSNFVDDDRFLIAYSHYPDSLGSQARKSILAIVNIDGNIVWQEGVPWISYVDHVFVYENEKIIICSVNDEDEILLLSFDMSGNYITKKTLSNKYGRITHMFVNMQNELVLTGKIETARNRHEYFHYVAKIDLESVTTGTNEKYIEPISSKIFVYPNPFSVSNSISYTVEKDADVKIELYDMQGNKVATVKDGFVSQGEYTEIINTSELLEGTYIFKIMIDGKLKTEKVVKVE